MRRPPLVLGPTCLLGSWILLLLTTTARAEAPGPFVDLALGRSLPRPADLHLAQPSRGNSIVLRSVRFNDASSEFPLYYRIRVGFRPGRPSWLGLALELVHSKLHARLDVPRRTTGRWRGEPIDEMKGRARLIERTHHLTLGVGWSP